MYLNMWVISSILNIYYLTLNFVACANGEVAPFMGHNACVHFILDIIQFAPNFYAHGY